MALIPPLIQIDIEDGSGSKLGMGPIESASRLRSTARVDKAGVFEFDMAASDTQAALIQPRRIMRAWAFLDGQRTELGAGIIDRIQHTPNPDGTVSLRVGGDDLVRELTARTVKGLKLYFGGLPVTHDEAVSAIEAYAPPGWSFASDPAPAHDSVYGYFNGETVLAAAAKIAQKSYNHFYRGSGRSLIYQSVWDASGIRAMQAHGELAANTAAIKRLTRTVNTYDLITRIYPRGSGNSNVELTLRATTRTAPAGFVLNTTQNYIEYSAATSAYGLWERQVDFKEIGPVENTSADVVAASNALFDAALETLRRRSSEIVQATYTLALEGCTALLRPMQTVYLTYRDVLAGLELDTHLNILEATTEVSEAGIFTTGLVVSNADRWPQSDASSVADGIEQGHLYSSLQQINANSYPICYTKNVDNDHSATFRFRFGNEVTQLQQVRFDFQLLPFESTVKSVGAESVSSGSGGSSTPTTSSGGSSTPTTSSGGSQTPTTPSGGGSSTPSGGGSTTVSGGGSTTPSGGAGTSGVTGAAVMNHSHDVEVTGLSIVSGSPVYFNTTNGLHTASGAGVQSGPGTTLRNLQNHQHSTPDHSHSTPNHSHATPDHTHTTPNHQHTVTIVDHQHTVTISAHQHTVTIAAHTHTVTPLLVTRYGIFRDGINLAPTALEYRVNGSAWDELSDAVDVGDGWWALDITPAVQEPDTFCPLQENNFLEIRAKSSASYAISGWTSFADGTTIIFFSGPVAIDTGATVVVEGADVSVGGVNVNGERIVGSVGVNQITVDAGGGVVATGGAGGTVVQPKRGTIDAQMTVRSTIQAVQLT